MNRIVTMPTPRRHRQPSPARNSSNSSSNSSSNRSPGCRRRRRLRRRATGPGGPPPRLLALLVRALALALHGRAVRRVHGGSSGSRSGSSSRGGFDPYALDGGLVAAVAGRDYALLAADTRLTDGGYGIRSRGYLGGRVWAAAGPRYDGASSASESESESDSDSGCCLFEADGSLRIPRGESAVPVAPPPSSSSSSESAAPEPEPEHQGTRTRRRIADPFGLALVGAAGCASDCEQLKRTVRAEVAARGGWARPHAAAAAQPAQPAPTPAASTVATLLLHALYSRRPFPYYAFCVLAGLDAATGAGRVHVYDAIGSGERVAVACAGAPGREMLQPVLDRLFAAPSPSPSPRPGDGDVRRRLVRDGTALGAAGQRAGSSLPLRPPVGTHVACGADEAVMLLVKAYRSVSEREIGTGDDLVVCVLRSGAGSGGDGGASVEVMRFPLKKH